VYNPEKYASLVTDFRQITDQKKKKRAISWRFRPRAQNQTNWCAFGDPKTLGVDAERKAQNRNAVGTLQPPMIRRKRKGEEVWAF
jgi:hypothetical protein